MRKSKRFERPHPKREEMQRAALTRAVTGASIGNFGAIIEGFAAKGIPVEDIRPRENVFTYDAWRALGRQVRKGEKGVKVATFIEATKEEDGATTTFKRPWATTVFHISQTDAIEARGDEVSEQKDARKTNGPDVPPSGPIYGEPIKRQTEKE